MGGRFVWGVEGTAGLGRAAAPESAQRHKRRRSYSKNNSFRQKIRQNDDLCHNGREKVRPARPLQRCFREKVRPARPLQRCFREKVRPARHKPPILGHISCAGRIFSRSRPPSDRAGRTFSRTEHSHVPTLKPITPLQPLIRANVKPPAPLLAPEQQPLKPPAPMLAPEQRPLKPPSPLQPKNAPKTPISRPQRRWRFQLGLSLREQRRCRFHPRLALREQRRRRFQLPPLTGPQRRRRFHTRDFRCRWEVAGPGRASSRHITAQHRRRRRCGGRRRARRARAGFEIDHSEPQARVWRSRGRPGPTAPGTPARRKHHRTEKPQNSS